jgi:D-alanyl-D-alanine carboxypeptidase
MPGIVRRALLLSFVALPAALRAQQRALPAPAQVARVLDSLGSGFIRDGRSPGTTIAVVRGRDTLLFAGYGSANLELGVPVTTNTVFRIGSVTKQFTSAAVMKLVELGKLSLADTIGAWLPTLPVAWRGVTITQLLNHTSGIPSYTDLGASWVKRWGEEMTGAEIISMVSDKPMDFPPGTKWKYNNSGYVLLGMLLEARVGRAWGQHFAEQFFTPMGMTRSRYCDTRSLIPGRASGYASDSSKAWVNAAYLAMSQPHAAGAMCSTIGDLVTWNRALHTGRVVSPASYTAMTTPVGAGIKPSGGYGFGLGRDQINGTPIITHTGGINGFLTANLWVPSAELSVTVLTNGESANPDRLAMQLARAALGIPLERDRLPIVALTDAQRAVYLGTYALMLGPSPTPFKVFAKDGKLFGELQGQSAAEMLSFGNHTFGADFDPSVRIVFAVTNGAATKMTLRQNGQSMDGTRTP